MAIPSFDDVPSSGHAPIPPNVADQVTAAVSRKIVGWLAGVIAVGVVALISAGIVFYSTVHADAARNDTVHTQLIHDVEELERKNNDQAVAHAALVAQYAGLTTKIDNMQLALTRIQGLLDERLPPAPRRRR